MALRWVGFILILSYTWLYPKTPISWASFANQPGYKTVQDEGTDLEKRRFLNLKGTGVSCVDNVSTEVTDCTVSGGLASTDIDTSSELATIVTDETGSGALVFANSPVFTTPNIGSATGSITGNAGTATALAADGSNCSAGSGAGGVGTNGASQDCTDYEEDLANSAGLAAALSDETGTVLAVFSNSPTLVTPTIGAALATSLELEGTTADDFEAVLSGSGDPTEDITAKWQLPANRDIVYPGVEDAGTVTFLPGYSDLQITNGGTAATQVTITADWLVLRDSSDVTFVAKNVSETCTITTSGIQGLEASDSEAASTFYEIHIYAKEDGTVDCLLNAQGTAVGTTPSGYVYSRFVGNVRNNSASDFLVFYQFNELVHYDDDAAVLSGGTATTYTNVDASGMVPATSRVALIRRAAGSTLGNHCDFYRMDGSSAVTAYYIATKEFGQVQFQVILSTAQVFEYKNDTACTATPSLTLNVFGYVENL